MEKIALKCDVCGGTLTMQPGGQGAICEYCGMNYAIGRLREKVQEIRGTVKVEGVVKTENADFEVKAGVLLHYHGKETTVTVPEGIKEIGGDCFRGMKYLTSVSFSRGLTRIGGGAFAECTGLKQITFPQGLTEIGWGAFQGCTGLTQISFPQSLRSIGFRAFSGCTELTEITLPPNVTDWGGAFGDSKIKKLTVLGNAYRSISFISDHCLEAIYPSEAEDYIAEYLVNQWKMGKNNPSYPSPWEQEMMRKHNLCQHCGYKFEGLVIKKCARCHKPKDY